MKDVLETARENTEVITSDDNSITLIIDWENITAETEGR
jgi:hypothetical protein